MKTDYFTGDYSNLPNTDVNLDVDIKMIEKDYIIFFEKNISPISFNLYDSFMFQKNEDVIDPKVNYYSSNYEVKKKKSENVKINPEKQKKIKRYKIKRKKRLEGNYIPHVYKSRQLFAKNRLRKYGRFVKIH